MNKRRSFSKVLAAPKTQPLSRDAIFASGGEQLGKWEIVGTGNNVWSHRIRVAAADTPAELRHSYFGGNTYAVLYGAKNATDTTPYRPQLQLASSNTDGAIYWGTTEIILLTGAQAWGFACIRGKPAGAGDTLGTPVPYQAYTSITNVPSSITFSTPGTTDVNVNSVAAADKTVRGFRFDVVSTAAGDVQATRTYHTNGN